MRQHRDPSFLSLFFLSGWHGVVVGKGKVVGNGVHAWRWLVSVQTVLYASDVGAGVGGRAVIVRTPGAPRARAMIVGCVCMRELVRGLCACAWSGSSLYGTCQHQAPARAFMTRDTHTRVPFETLRAVRRRC